MAVFVQDLPPKSTKENTLFWAKKSFFAIRYFRYFSRSFLFGALDFRINLY
jgi:hypothetical protein